MIERLDDEGSLRRTLATLSREERAYLLERLTCAEETRQVGDVRQEEIPRSLAELLQDLEGEPEVRAIVVRLLGELQSEHP